MNGLINQHMIELLAIVIAVISYIILHFAIRYSAIFISGQKKGIIRQCLQGFVVVACFIVAMLISCNGAVRYYHICTYIILIVILLKSGACINNHIIKRAKEIKSKDAVTILEK